MVPYDVFANWIGNIDLRFKRTTYKDLFITVNTDMLKKKVVSKKVEFKYLNYSSNQKEILLTHSILELTKKNYFFYLCFRLELFLKVNLHINKWSILTVLLVMTLFFFRKYLKTMDFCLSSIKVSYGRERHHFLLSIELNKKINLN